MVARTENMPCTRASFTSSSDPRSSGSSKNIPASLVAVHVASAVDSIKTILFCVSSLKPSSPPLLDLSSELLYCSPARTIPRWCAKHDGAAGSARQNRDELELASTAAIEESVASEGYKSHEHDRSEQSGE
jgi:hypothetical protein